MSVLDQDPSMPIELRESEIRPSPAARGILVGVLLGSGAWAAIMALLVAAWTWLT